MDQGKEEMSSIEQTAQEELHQTTLEFVLGEIKESGDSRFLGKKIAEFEELVAKQNSL